MKSGNPIKRALTSEALPIVAKSQTRGGGAHFSFTKVCFRNHSAKSNPKPQNPLNVSLALESGKQSYTRRRIQPLLVVVASTEGRSSGEGTPLEPRSAEGVLLGNILQNQHLFKYAVSKQLNELASEKNRQAASKEESLDSLLHRRIVEMKEKQRQVAVEDIMYMCIVQKFSGVGVPMVQKLSKRISKNNLETLPFKCTDLDSFHSPEVQNMIRKHLDTVVCMTARSNAVDMSRTSKVDRLHLGKIYAKSILYGYFLKAACLRRQFDSNLAHSKANSQHLGQGTYSSVPELHTSGFEGIATVGQSTDAQAQLTSSCDDTRNESLMSYVMGFDAKSVQRCAKLKSKEAVNIYFPYISDLDVRLRLSLRKS